MHIKMKITNIKSISNFEFNIPLAQGLYALTGENACGKSTLISCASRSFYEAVPYSYFGIPIEDAKIEFEYNDKQRILGSSKGTWLNAEGSLGIIGFYEGSLIYSNRFKDVDFSRLKILSSIKETDLLAASVFITENLGSILHDDKSYYSKMFVMKPEIQRQKNLLKQPYYYKSSNKLVNQLEMSTGENLLISILHSLEMKIFKGRLLGIMMAGYPTKTHGKSASEAYMATQVAVQHFVFQHSDKYPNPKGVKFTSDSWEHWESTAITVLAKTIYEEGIKNPFLPENGAVGVKIEASNDGKFKEVGDNLEMTLDIQIDGTFTKGKLTFDSFVRDMIKSNPNCKITVGSRTASFETGILGTTDYEEGIKVLPGETTAKIVLSKSSAESYMDFEYSGDMKSGSYTASKEVMQSFVSQG